MTTATARFLVGLSLVGACAAALAQAGSAPTRGQLLYNTHCVACHDKQLHWRQNKKAVNWKTLVAQVRHWQRAEKLAWSDEDITQVARYLNDTIYRYPVVSIARQD